MVKIGFLAKKYSDFARFHNFRPFFIKISEKLIFQKLVINILKPGSIKIERGMKKYFRGFILSFCGLMGSSLVPGEGPIFRTAITKTCGKCRFPHERVAPEARNHPSRGILFMFFSPMGPENLEPQKLKFRKFFQRLGTNGHPIAPKILKTRHSKFLKGLIQQRSTLGAKYRCFFFRFFVKILLTKKKRKIGFEKIDLFDHFIP